MWIFGNVFFIVLRRIIEFENLFVIMISLMFCLLEEFKRFFRCFIMEDIGCLKYNFVSFFEK